MTQSMDSVLPHGAARFCIKEEIAETLQGRILLGIDLTTNKPVVIKEAWRELVQSGLSRKGHKVQEDFMKERDLLLTLSNLGDCAGIAKGIDKWDSNRCHYYAMELCEAELFDYISDQSIQTDYHKEGIEPQIPMHSPNVCVQNVTKIFHQLCVTVAWLHSKGYCHLDLSLENVMISDIHNLKVKLIDFGVAQKFSNDFKLKGRVGKIGYMCPEAYSGQVFNAKAADVWSLGVILFMMLIGSPPYQRPQPESISAFQFIVSGRMKDVLKHWKRLRFVTSDALDLLDKIFKYEKKRILLEEILQHSFFEKNQ